MANGRISSESLLIISMLTSLAPSMALMEIFCLALNAQRLDEASGNIISLYAWHMSWHHAECQNSFKLTRQLLVEHFFIRSSQLFFNRVELMQGTQLFFYRGETVDVVQLITIGLSLNISFYVNWSVLTKTDLIGLKDLEAVLTKTEFYRVEGLMAVSTKTEFSISLYGNWYLLHGNWFC